MPGTGGGWTTIDLRLLDIGDDPEQLALDRGGRFPGIAGAPLERLQHQEGRAGIGRIGEARAGEADDIHRA